MSERPIAVGDLVVVVRTCCQGVIDKWRPIFGVPKTVVAISTRNVRCAHCTFYSNTMKLADLGIHQGFDQAPVAWLKRIPPLSELESTRTEEKTKAPA